MTAITIAPSLPSSFSLYSQSEFAKTSFASLLAELESGLPMGSFLLANPYPQPIMSVVTHWQLTDRNGKQTKAGINCDGFLGMPARPIAEASESVLITRRGCVRSEYLSLVATGPMIGGPILQDRLLVQNERSSIASVLITVDSVILEDGAIFGPDTANYTTEIIARNRARESLKTELSQAPDDVAKMLVLAAVMAQGRPSRTREDADKAVIATSLSRGPYRPQRIAQLQNDTPLPAFHKGEK